VSEGGAKPEETEGEASAEQPDTPEAAGQAAADAEQPRADAAPADGTDAEQPAAPAEQPGAEQPAAADAPAAEQPAADTPAAEQPAADAPGPAAAAAPEVVRLDEEAGIDESWFANFADWVKTHPMLALVMFLLIFVGPFVVNVWHQNRVRAQLHMALDAWQGELLEAGLPIPYVPPKDLPLPSGFPQAPDELFEWAGFLERKQTLSAWRVRLGGAAPDMPTGQDPWAAAVRVCLRLHRAEAKGDAELDGLETDLALSPAEVRPVLELTRSLVRGERGVLGRVRELLSDPPPGCQRPLRALLFEAERRQIERTLSGRPPPKKEVQTLLRLARSPSQPSPLPEALERASEEALRGVLTPGDGDLERAEALIEAFAILRAKPAGARLGQAWDWTRAGVADVLAAHWADPQRPLGPGLELLDRLRQADPEADVPLTALAGWRDQLQSVVNDPRRLGHLVRKLLELGYLPRTLEAVLLDAEVPAGDTPGLALFRALRASAAFARGSADPPDPALWKGVESALAGRDDPIARRILAQRAFWGAVEERLITKEGEAWIARARALGYQPSYRLLAEESHALEGAAQQKALEEALKDLQATGELPEARLSLDPARARALEAQGRPTSRDAAAVERSRLLALRGLHALEAGQDAQAQASAAEALSAARTALAYELMARAELKRGRIPQAFQAVRNGLNAAPTPRERARLETLQKAMGPR